MNLFKVLIINILFIPVIAISQDCLKDFPEIRYFRAVGSGATEDDARSRAMSNLIGQFPSNFSVRKQQREVDTDGQVTGIFTAETEVQSQLRLMGVQFNKCESRRRRSKEVNVVAFISRQDLERSAQDVGRKVKGYLDLMQEKSAGGAIEEAIMAYLYTFLSPKIISEEVEGKTQSDIQAYLESYLRNHLAGIKLRCLRVSADPGYASQFTLNLSPEGTYPGADVGVEIPAYNAKGKIPYDGGPLGLIMQPASRNETMRARISLEPRVLPDELRGLSVLSRISRDVSLTADFSNIIRIAIKRDDQGDSWKYNADIQSLSIRQWEWFVDGKLRTLQPVLVMPKREAFSIIRLRVNGDEELAREFAGPIPAQRQPEPEAAVAVVEPVSQTQPTEPQAVPEKSEHSKPVIPPISRPVQPKLSDLPESILQIAGTQGTDDLEKMLGALQKSGKIMIGQKSDFMRPEKCWVIVVGSGGGIQYLLSPEASGRREVKTSKVFSNFESELSRELKGAAVLWIETY